MRQGFSLLELSIVLVIIGLITGGIMAGQSMVRAAELRSVMTDINKYRTAINTFKEKYVALPGDMKNATQYWGVAAAGAACATTQGTGTQTCDGNGDGIISNGGNEERYRIWQHLANAGLIEGQYTGIVDPTYTYVAGSNIPASKLTSVGYTLYWYGQYAGDTARFAGSLNHVMNIYGFGNLSTNYAFTPGEMFSMDTKMDDGKPATGKLGAVWWSVCTNATSNTDTAATYLVSSNGKLCGMQVSNFLEQ